MGPGSDRSYVRAQGAPSARRGKETAVSHAFAIAARVPTLTLSKVSTVNWRLIGVLALNVGFWALVILAGRALYA